VNEAKTLSLVIPVFNEKESLEPLLAEIEEVARALPDRTVETIFVDDGSRDGSWDVIAALAAKNPRVRGLRFQRNFGKAAALNAGFRNATGDIVMTLDADLQDDPHEIPEFLKKLDEGFDLVSGYKQKRNDPIYKVLPSRIFNWMVSTVTGVKLHDHNCGFKAYRSPVTKDVRLYGELHRYVPVLAASKGYKVGERVVNHRARKYGSSKFGFERYLKGFLDLMQVKFTTRYGWRPMHFFGTLGFFAYLTGFGMMVLAIVLAATVSSTWFGTLAALGASFTLAMIGSQALFSGFRAEAALNTRHGDPFIISGKTP
jgi:glycosyltransferase involved in cell wall biosynthesis